MHQTLIDLLEEQISLLDSLTSIDTELANPSYALDVSKLRALATRRDVAARILADTQDRLDTLFKALGTNGEMPLTLHQIALNAPPELAERLEEIRSRLMITVHQATKVRIEAATTISNMLQATNIHLQFLDPLVEKRPKAQRIETHV